MRMAFFVGGIVGAAAAMYFAKNRRMMAVSPGQIGHMMNDLVETAKNRLADAVIAQMNKNGHIVSSQHSSHTAASAPHYAEANASAHDAKHIEEMIQESPELKAEVNAILEDNRVSL